MGVAMDLTEHYKAVLLDMKARRARLLAQISDLDVSIGAIQRQADAAKGFDVSSHTIPAVIAKPEYGKVSVRWGTMWHLAESVESAKTSDIATALLQGGFQTNAANFTNMVSAVLSAMKSSGEVELADGGEYRLTDLGREKWRGIKKSPKFKEQVYASGPTLLS
jgi:hypothetical protein